MPKNDNDVTSPPTPDPDGPSYPDPLAERLNRVEQALDRVRPDWHDEFVESDGSDG